MIVSPFAFEVMVPLMVNFCCASAHRAAKKIKQIISDKDLVSFIKYVEAGQPGIRRPAILLVIQAIRNPPADC